MDCTQFEQSIKELRWNAAKIAFTMRFLSRAGAPIHRCVEYWKPFVSVAAFLMPRQRLFYIQELPKVIDFISRGKRNDDVALKILAENEIQSDDDNFGDDDANVDSTDDRTNEEEEQEQHHHGHQQRPRRRLLLVRWGLGIEPAFKFRGPAFGASMSPTMRTLLTKHFPRLLNSWHSLSIVDMGSYGMLEEKHFLAIANTSKSSLKSLLCARSGASDTGQGQALTDRVLDALAQNCPLLEQLSMFMEDNFTEHGMLSIARNCHLLQSIHSIVAGDAITDNVLEEISQNCKKIRDLVLLHAKLFTE